MRSHVAKAIIQLVLDEAKTIVRHALSLYGKPCGSEFKELVEHQALFVKSPPKRHGPSFNPYGKKRGWSDVFGGGRLFDDVGCDAIQDATKDAFAELLGSSIVDLVRVHEKISFKPAGARALPLHIDGNRRGGFQVVIALTAHPFLVCPYSHQLSWLDKHQEYHELSASEKNMLQRNTPPVEIPANPGDVLVMQGGRLVHGGVSIGEGLPRITAYSHFVADAKKPSKQRRTQ